MSKEKSSSLKKPDVAITASSFYSRETLSTPSVNTKRSSNSSVDTLVTLPLEEDQTKIDIPSPAIKNEKVAIPTSLSSSPSVISTVVEKEKLNKSNSILQRSLSFLTRSESKKSESQLVKVHRYTIYDDETGEFIEIVDEEWEGDGPRPRKSTDSQKKGVIILDKDLPSLPEPPVIKKKTPIAKFNQWLKDKYPPTGAFAKSKNNGLQMNGKGDGTFYDPGIGIGACGKINTADEFIGAMNAQQFGVSPICGKCVNITGPKGSVKVKIVDKCSKCKFGDIDISPVAFNAISDGSQDRISITWEGKDVVASQQSLSIVLVQIIQIPSVKSHFISIDSAMMITCKKSKKSPKALYHALLVAKCNCVARCILALYKNSPSTV
ncbi:15221_t:CDS:2 [Funneliformis mosseae]|uniref:15221_t:CDS:1 n=1 Tax=Funneliformis mosseae TaxID=27381 RepID=A0A9N9B3L9_FUNMO|nr:15221_t:CDS:2 [Funneliformis mosseae]